MRVWRGRKEFREPEINEKEKASGERSNEARIRERGVIEKGKGTKKVAGKP